ncbi:MAG TPA: flagellar biosynthetic protein FliR [Terracidiphilus sp.]|jgi:flagellar biosynthetic protein FliR|nr:flagellar biosynthetic protein FliR [Terracidiphilus sp.]
MIELPLMSIITSLLTIGVRLSGLMLFAPFFGSVIIPARIKAILVFALTLFLYPTVGHQIDPHVMSNWPMLIITEFLIGVGMGIATNIVFEGIQLTGQILGMQMGYSLINILDPQTQVDTTVMATFYQCIVMLLFLQMDVHFWLLRAVGNSFRYVPPGTGHLSSLFTTAILKTVGEIFGLGVQIAAPVLAATLAADVVLGLLGKSSPQMPLMLLGPAVKSLLGIGVLIATLKYWPDLFRRLFTDAVANGEHLFHLAS